MYKETSTFMKYLKTYNAYLTKQQYKTLRGKAIQGDILSARKGLVTLLRRQNINVSLDKGR